MLLLALLFFAYSAATSVDTPFVFLAAFIEAAPRLCHLSQQLLLAQTEPFVFRLKWPRCLFRSRLVGPFSMRFVRMTLTTAFCARVAIGEGAATQAAPLMLSWTSLAQIDYVVYIDGSHNSRA